jgi:hypothetical protein
MLSIFSFALNENRMITTALKWLLDNIPMVLIPAQFHLAIKLVKSLVPLIGYIGGFIAWSWSGIKTFDKGIHVSPWTLIA